MVFLLQCTYITADGCTGHYQPYLVPLALSVSLFGAYLFAAATPGQAHRPWSMWRTLCFTFGCAVLVLSFSPSLIDSAHHNFMGHSVQHLLLGMLAPIGLVLGAPVSLLLRTVSVNKAKKVTCLLHHSFFQGISHPVVVLFLNTGALYIFYLTPLFRLAHVYPLVHFGIQLHVLLAGYLFTWTLIGPDPAPRRLKMKARVLLLFISIAAHAFLTKYMFAYVYPKTEVHSTAQIKEGAKLMYYGGDAIELLLLILLFSIWYQRKGKPHYQIYL